MAAFPRAPKAYVTRPVIGPKRPRDPNGGKRQAPGHRVSDKGPYDPLESKRYPNTMNGKYEVV